MEVFLVPVARERYELYCEVPDEPDAPDAEPPRGFIRRMVHRFREMIAEARALFAERIGRGCTGNDEVPLRHIFERTPDRFDVLPRVVPEEQRDWSRLR